MVAANGKNSNRRPGGFASRRRSSLCRSVISVADRPVDCLTALCHDDRQSRFPLRSPPLPRGSKNFVSPWLCGEKSISGTQTLANNLYQGMALDPVTGLYYERARWYRTGQAGLRQEPKSSRRIGTGSVHREISQDPLSYINGANTYQFVGDGPVGRVDASGLAVLYGVVDPTGSAFGVFPNSGGHAIIVISDPASPSGWLVYSFQLGGWHEYDFNQYRNKPYNRHRPIELWALPGASARLARADVERQIKHGNDTYARGAKVCSTASAEVAAAATVGKPIHGDIDSFRSSTVNGTGEPRQYPNALPRYLVQQGDIPPSGIHNYPAPGGQAAGGSSSGSSSASSGSSSSSSGGFWHWIASWF